MESRARLKSLHSFLPWDYHPHLNLGRRGPRHLRIAFRNGRLIDTDGIRSDLDSVGLASHTTQGMMQCIGKRQQIR